MKEYLEKRREELKKRGESGFTLMEMLIVVAIIAILIAIAIPVFTSQLENARDATTLANLRSAYAEAMVDFMENPSELSVTKDVRVESTDDNYGEAESKLPFTLSGKQTAGDRSVTFSFSSSGNQVSATMS